ncbi:hypothetical protein [Arthrobacter sp. NPDC058127]|uniref:hypothetical protein n=1 Tax=Arthrobacter sp. NPDC058127 TaxID=3346351 RepID=UPI0036ED93A9
MAAGLPAKGLALRPHGKAHKIPQIAAPQLEARAVGLTVATIGEAEVVAGSSVSSPRHVGTGPGSCARLSGYLLRWNAGPGARCGLVELFVG